MGTAITIILGILKAIPILDAWFQQLSTAYTVGKIASFKKENLEALRKAINEKDQRDLEAAVGNPHPGEASGDAGAVIIDAPPSSMH